MERKRQQTVLTHLVIRHHPLSGLGRWVRLVHSIVDTLGFVEEPSPYPTPHQWGSLTWHFPSRASAVLLRLITSSSFSPYISSRSFSFCQGVNDPLDPPPGTRDSPLQAQLCAGFLSIVFPRSSTHIHISLVPGLQACGPISAQPNSSTPLSRN